MKLKYKYFNLVKMKSWYNIMNGYTQLGYIEKWKGKFVLIPFQTETNNLIWYSDCLDELSSVLKKLNKK